MTLQELLASSLERLGAAGLAYPGAKTTTNDTYMSLVEIRKGCDMPEEYMLDCIVVWASADGTLFPSAEERDAHDGVVITNEKHFGAKCSGDNDSAEARAAQCKKQLCSDCRIGIRAAAENRCYQEWDKAPYGMPLDKRIPWPKQP